jgi:beta-lysine N6-acetyltransferase
MDAFDATETIGESLIQHGTSNDRVYVMKITAHDSDAVLDRVDELVSSEAYSKVFAKVPASLMEPFLAAGYEIEALAPGLYRGVESGLFLGYYPAPANRRRIDQGAVKKVVRTALSKRDKPGRETLPATCMLRQLAPEDAPDAARIYRGVFESYPFPIHDPAYIVRTMRTHVDYFGIWEENRLIALASAERDDRNLHAEMTDFATLPSCRGRGFATILLDHMEDAMRNRKCRCLFTIARALSYGMNCTFGKRGYRYGGTLRNNTQIAGSLESMNVWYKQL